MPAHVNVDESRERLAAHGVGDGIAVDRDHVIDVVGGVGERSFPETIGVRRLHPDAVVALVH